MILDELRNADPARGSSPYSDDRVGAEVAAIAASQKHAPGVVGRRRRAATLGASGFLAVAVLTVSVSVWQPAQPSAQAIERFEQAAHGSAGALPSGLAADQYLQVTTTSEQVSVGNFGRPGERQGDKPTGDPVLAYMSGTTKRVEYRTASGVGRRWAVQTNSPQRKIAGSADAPAQVAGPADIVWSWDIPTISGDWATPTPDFQRGLPRDTQALRSRVYDGLDGDDQRAWNRISDALNSGTLTADTRSALYRVAATVPGVEVTDTTVDGRTVTAFSRGDDAGQRDELLIDVATGLPIGSRAMATDDTHGVPPGQLISSSRTVTRLVAGPPADVKARTLRPCSDTVSLETGCHQQ